MGRNIISVDCVVLGRERQTNDNTTYNRRNEKQVDPVREIAYDQRVLKAIYGFLAEQVLERTTYPA